jgi:hypothetical protein
VISNQWQTFPVAGYSFKEKIEFFKSMCHSRENGNPYPANGFLLSRILPPFSWGQDTAKL